MTDVGERLAEALAPLAQFISDNIDTIERAVAACDAWTINRLEALANGLIDVDDPMWSDSVISVTPPVVPHAAPKDNTR